MKGFNHTKLNVSHLSFTVIFATALYVIFNAINIEKIARWFPLADGTDYAGLAAYLVVGLCLFMAFFILLAHRWTIKPLAIIIIVLSAAATYFTAKYNVAIDRTMVMNSIHTDITEASGLLSVQMLPYVFFLIIVPILIILKTNITFQSTFKYLSQSLILFILVLSIGTGLVYLNFNTISRAANLSDKYIIHTLVPVNIIRSSISAVQRSVEPFYQANKKKVEIAGHVSSQEDLVVVLVIGESSRQKSFSLYGYDRKNTTPILSQDKELHLLNGIAHIGSTLYALPEILEKEGVKLPAITSKLGIKTSCYVNYTLYDNCEAVGEVAVSSCAHDGHCYDEDVIPLLDENLKSYSSGYRFIVLHMGGGSHGPSYRDRYPPEFQKFKPQCLDADVVNQCTLDELYNSYDNTILYVDHVLGNIIKRLDDSTVPYVFIYLSDHGESLMENGRIFHGMPPGIDLPAEQAQVPLIVKASIPVSIAEREIYEQQDVYDTVLDLFSIETDVLNKDKVFILKNVH